MDHRLELALAVALLTACRSEAPEPKKVSEVEPAVKPRVKPVRDGPFRNPNVDPPGPRSDTQLPDKKLQSILTRGKEQAARGRTSMAILTLLDCANRIPQSVECEAELGLIMFGADQHVAHARYYLAQAANAQPAEAEDELYRRVGQMAMSKSQYPTAAAAFGVLLAREKATADDLEALAHALQADGDRADEAADAYARAYELDPSRHELLRKRATLLGQQDEHQRAADLFEQYLSAAEPDDELRVAIEQRVALLRRQAQAQAPAGDEQAG